MVAGFQCSSALCSTQRARCRLGFAGHGLGPDPSPLFAQRPRVADKFGYGPRLRFHACRAKLQNSAWLGLRRAAHLKAPGRGVARSSIDRRHKQGSERRQVQIRLPQVTGNAFIHRCRYGGARCRLVPGVIDCCEPLRALAKDPNFLILHSFVRSSHCGRSRRSKSGIAVQAHHHGAPILRSRVTASSNRKATLY